MRGWGNCDMLAANVGLAAGIVCATLAMLIVALIALGFGVLHTRLAPAAARRLSQDAAGWDSGLPGVWRLYRQVGSATRDRPAPTLESAMDSDGQPAREQRLASAHP